MTACDLCGTHATRLGAVCQHLVHGRLLTYTTAPRPGDELADLACTHCDGQHKLDGWTESVKQLIAIHMLCAHCHSFIESVNLLATARDYDRGFALATRGVFTKARQGDLPLNLPLPGPIRVGEFVKVAFSPIPSIFPLATELMWLVTTEVGTGSRILAKLDNDPEHFGPDVLCAGARIELDAGNVLQVLPSDP